jgi:hypothetical protein
MGAPSSGGAFGTGFGLGSGFGTQQLGGGFGQQQGGMAQPQQPRVDEQSKHVLLSESPGIPWWYRELVRIQAAYRVCQFSKFQTMMYEVSPTAPDIHSQSMQVSLAMIEKAKAERKMQILAQVPWLENNMRQWHMFEERNPDPANWLPCPVIGVDALYDRVEAQAKYTKEQLQSVEKEKNKDWLVRAAADIRLLDQKIESCRRSHTTVTNRLVGVLGRLERLQARSGLSKGPRSSNEIRFHDRLEKLRKTIEDPKGCKAKLLQIEARLGDILKRRAAPLDDEIQPANELTSESKQTDAEYERRNQQLLAFMEEQRQSIAAVVHALRKDARDIKMMREKLAN